MRRRRVAGAGLGLVELVLVLVVLAVIGALLYAYLGSATRTLERVREDRPLGGAKLVADRATLAAIRATLQVYYGRHGSWPPNREALVALLDPPPRFQCEGNDFTYEPTTGEVRLLIDDPARC